MLFVVEGMWRARRRDGDPWLRRGGGRRAPPRMCIAVVALVAGTVWLCASSAGLVGALYSSYVVQFVELLQLSMVYHFHDMINMLIDYGYEKGNMLFGYGYDFRQSNRIDKAMVGFRTKLEVAYKASGGKKVNIIPHSMGGLLVCCFMSMNHDIFAKYVNKWICIACPFQGAPGCINDFLLTGLQFVYGFESFFFVSRWAMHQLLVECPSNYEMLPNPQFKWKEKRIVQVWRKNPEKDGVVELVLYEATDCISLFEEALKNNELWL